MNIHTVASPVGELRGQITVEPGRCDSATLASSEEIDPLADQLAASVGLGGWCRVR